MSNETVKAIMKRYPEAVSAVDGVRVGDVLCNGVNAPLAIVTEETEVHINNEYSELILSCLFIIGNADKVAV
jgi:hypothetical protein